MAGERELVRRAASGDSEAFGRLAAGCRPWLLGLCFRLVGDRAAAEDLVQEALVRAFRDLSQLRQPDHFQTWLSRVAVNACRMHLRQRLSGLQEFPRDSVPPPVPSVPEEPPYGVADALAKLDRDTRRLVLLFYAEGLSHQELADTLSLSAGAVKSRLHRARERLRREMLGMMTDGEKARLGEGARAVWSLRTVLLVQPDEGLRSSIRAALEAAGYEVVVLATGEEALAAINQRRGQLLVLDKHCGEPHWLEVMGLVQVDAWSRDNVPIGVLVDPGSERDVLLAWQAGAMFCLTRPPRIAEVVEYVRRTARLWREGARPHTPACDEGRPD